MMIVTTDLSRVERRKLITRQSMLDAGRSLIARQGIDELSVQAITEAADVALGTFYNYFDEKRDLFEALCEEDFQQISARFPEVFAPDDGPITQIAAITALGAARSHVDREFAAYVWQMSRGGLVPGGALTAVFLARHDEAVRRGLLPRTPPAVASAAYFGTTMYHCRAIAVGEVDTPLEESVATLLTIVLRALGAEPHIVHEATSTIMARSPGPVWS